MSPYALPLLGRLAWIDLILVVWFLLVFISVAYVAWDGFTRLPEPGVIKWAWVLTTLYLGPIGAAFYILADKEPRPGEHERYVAPMWKQALGSTLHCVSGDAAGVIIAATVTGLLGLPMWFDMTAEYVLGFAFGLFIFQALFMKDMMGGSYRKALTSSLIPEWVSMNAMMAGMFPTMVAIMMGRDMRAMDPRELLYWGTMSLAIGVGFVTAYPVNWWLVRKGLKHGLMTVRPAADHGSSGPGHDGRNATEPSHLQPVAAHEHGAHMHTAGA
jgi:manganese oxidase